MLNIGIYGYGNLGKGVEAAVSLNDDTKLVGVFTRRDPEGVRIATDGVGVYRVGRMASRSAPKACLFTPWNGRRS